MSQSRPFLTMLRHDLVIQSRYGVPVAAVVVLIVWLVALWPVPKSALPAALPVALFTDIAVFGYLFVAGLMYFERDERVLAALAVSPLGSTAYAASKIAAMTLIALFVTAAMVLLRPVETVGWPLLVTSALLTSVIVCGLGLAWAFRFATIHEFLMPSAALLAVLQLPVLEWLAVVQTPAMWLVPTYGAFRAMTTAVAGVAGAFTAIGTQPGAGNLVLDLGHALLWSGIAVALAARSFRGEPRHAPSGGAASARTLPVRSIVAGDVTRLVRDPVLLFLVSYPWLGLLLLAWFVPRVTVAVAAYFDLTAVYPLIVSEVALLTFPVLLGTVYGFLILDERDDGTLLAIRVTPVPITHYVAARSAIPAVLSVVYAFAAVAVLDLAHVPAGPLSLAAALAGLQAPLTALFLAAVASNKIEGLAWAKGLGFLFLVPVLAWFAPPPLHWLAGVVPLFWPVNAAWMAMAGEPGWGLVLAAGTVVQIAALALVARALRRRLGTAS